MTAKSKRHKVYMGGHLQRRIVTRLAIYWGLYHIVLFHGMFFLRYLTYRNEVLNGEAPVPFVELYGTFAWDNFSLVICAAAVCPLILWDMVLLTHRVAGPLWSLERTLERMAKGEVVHKIKFRNGDLVDGLERAFNAYLASPYAKHADHAAEGALDEDNMQPQSIPVAVAEPVSASARRHGSEDFGNLLADLHDIGQTIAPVKNAETPRRCETHAGIESKVSHSPATHPFCG
jgi:hypothetical protein